MGYKMRKNIKISNSESIPNLNICYNEHITFKKTNLLRYLFLFFLLNIAVTFFPVIANPKMANLTQLRPDRLRIFFTEIIKNTSIINRNNFHISGTASIITSLPIPSTSLDSDVIELRITGLEAGTLYTLASDSLECLSGTTTEAGELSFKTPTSIKTDLTWQKPSAITLSSGGFVCSNALTYSNNTIISAYEKSGDSEMSDLKIFSANGSEASFIEKNLSENSRSAHVSSYDSSWPDMNLAPLVNPGTNMAVLDNNIAVTWSGINYQQGKLYAAFSSDSGKSFLDDSILSWSPGLNIAALTPSIAMEQNLTPGENLIFIALVKTVFDTDINSNTITKSRDLVVLRVAGPLSSPNALGKNYSIISEKTIYSGNSSGYPANPQLVLKNHTLHVAFTLFNPSSKKCGIRYGRFDFDHARGTLDRVIDFKDPAPYSSLAIGPRLAWQNNNIILSYITLDHFMKADLVSMYSPNSGLTFSNSTPLTSLMLDFNPWIDRPVFLPVSSLFSYKNSNNKTSSDQNSTIDTSNDQRITMLARDLRIDENMSARTLHRLIIIDSKNSGISWGTIESPGKPTDNNYFEYANRPGSLIETSNGTGVVYTSSDTFAEGSSQGFSRIFIRNRDFTPPSLVSAIAENPSNVLLSFDEPMDSTEAILPGNYSFNNSNITVYSARISADNKSITLTCSEMTSNMILTVSCLSLKDLAGNMLLNSASAATFTVPVSSSPVSAWIPPQRLSYEAGDSLVPQVEVLNNSVLTIWSDYRDNNSYAGRPNSELYTRFSTNKGVSWEPVTRITNQIEYSLAPDLWVSDAGYTLVWQDFRDKNFEIYQAGFDSTGAWSQEARLTRDFGSSLNPAVIRQNNNIYTVWADNRDGDSDIYIMYSDNAGLTWSSNIALTHNSSESTHPTIVPGKNNRIYLAWQDDQSLIPSIWFKRWTHDDSNSGSSILISGSLPAQNPTIACDSDENIMICWQAKTGVDINGDSIEQIYFSNSDDNGENWSSPKTYSDFAGKISGLSMASTGKIIYTAFSDNRNGFFDVFVKSTTTSGAQASSSINISSGQGVFIPSNSTNPSVSAWGNLAAVVYEDDKYGDKEIMFSINSNIIPAGPEFTIASFLNPADKKDMFVLVKSSKQLETAPIVKMFNPQSSDSSSTSGVTIETNLLKSNIWLSRLKNINGTSGLIRFSAIGIDIFGNSGSDMSGSYVAKTSASGVTNLESPDSMFKYSISTPVTGKDVLLSTHISDMIVANRLASSGAIVNASLSDLILFKQCTPVYTINSSAEDIKSTMSFNIIENSSANLFDNLVIASAPGSVKNMSLSQIKNKTGIFEIVNKSGSTLNAETNALASSENKTDESEYYVNFLGSYQNLNAGIEIPMSSSCFLAVDSTPPSIDNVELSLDENEIIVSATLSDNGSGINEDLIKISCTGSVTYKNFIDNVLKIHIQGLEDDDIELSVSDMLNNSVKKQVSASAITAGMGIKSFISWPNPASVTANLRVESDMSVNMDHLKIKIYDISGNRVKDIPGLDFIAQTVSAGYARYEFPWDLTNSDGQSVANGTYICRMIYTATPSKEIIFKITVLR